MSTTARKHASMGASDGALAFTARISGKISAVRASDAAASVVSTTEYATVYVLPAASLVNLNCFMSPLTSAYGVIKESAWDLARNCLAASSLTSFTPTYCTSMETMRSSHAVVVGDRRLSVSERMAERRRPAMFLGRNTPMVA